MPKDRLLFIDILRIVGISLITFHHISPYYPELMKYYLSFNVWNMYIVSYAEIGIWIFLFASGLSLACNHLNIDTRAKIKEFYTKRLLRIYPAYYTAIIVTVVAEPDILQRNFSVIDYIKMATGLQALGAKTVWDILGKVNGPFWFLTPLIFLYLMYPLLSYAMRKHPHISMIAIFAIAEASIYVMSQTTVFFEGISWFPLCRLFEFSLGIYLFRIGLYSKMISKNSVIIYLSSISFYAYLINEPMHFNLGKYPIMFTVGLLVVSTMLYKFDNSLKSAITAVSNGLKRRI